MQRTSYSLEEPVPYRDALALADQSLLIEHILKLEALLEARDRSVTSLERAVATRDTQLSELAEQAGKGSEGQREALRQRDETIATLEDWKKDAVDTIATLRTRYQDAERRAAALEADTKALRAERDPLTDEDRLQVQTFLRILENPDATYYSKPVSRAFATTVRRLLALPEEPADEPNATVD